MIPMNTRFSRRTFAVASAAVSVGVLGASRGVLAQDATPMASPAEAAGLFDSTGLTEIVISAEQYTFTAAVPGALAEGWYIITLQNNSDAVASANLGLLPEGTSGGDLTSVISQSFQGQGGELPDWWLSATFAGGNIASPGTSTSTLAYLTPGKWFLFSTNPASAQSPSSFSILTPEELEANYGIAADASATPMASPATTAIVAPEGVVATVNVEVTDMAVTPDGAPTGGEQILQVTNGGEQVHDVVILHTEDVLDEAGAASLATSWISGEETNAMVAGGVGTLSPGLSAFAGVDVQPGTYAIFSSLPDANGGLQVDSGLVAIFTAQ